MGFSVNAVGICFEKQTCSRPVLYSLQMDKKAAHSSASITIYTDGGCIGNPGPGGYGAVIISGAGRQELSGGFHHTTNNRMELTAAIVALRSLNEPGDVQLYSDSRYLVDGISKGWAEQWRANHWRRKDRSRALNPDLWEQLLTLCTNRQVTFFWVRGHRGNPENERCDKLSIQAAKGKNLPHDTVYEQEMGSSSSQGALF